jgi:hypothetical protein
MLEFFFFQVEYLIKNKNLYFFLTISATNKRGVSQEVQFLKHFKSRQVF